MGSAAETIVHLVQIWAEKGEGAPRAPSHEPIRKQA
jgi:hypothetical protein